jgi:hypothetical protein
MPSHLRHLAALALLAAALAGCGGSADDAGPYAAAVDGAQPGPSQLAAPMATQAGEPLTVGSADPSVAAALELCDRIAVLRSRLAALTGLELRPTARVTLDIELSRVQAGFSDMRQAASDARELDLAEPLRRLGYRLDGLALAVEDFRTTSRPREAARHVEEEGASFADTLAGFELQAGC